LHAPCQGLIADGSTPNSWVGFGVLYYSHIKNCILGINRGLEIKRYNQGIAINQSEKCKKIIEKRNFNNTERML